MVGAPTTVYGSPDKMVHIRLSNRAGETVSIHFHALIPARDLLCTLFSSSGISLTTTASAAVTCSLNAPAKSKSSISLYWRRRWGPTADARLPMHPKRCSSLAGARGVPRFWRHSLTILSTSSI